jgi:hypothetical protein
MSAWPDNLNIRPIETWPGERTRGRQDAPFKAGLSATLGTLTRELRMLRATDVWLEVAMTDHDFRQDGRPKANARAFHPGVVLSFHSHTLGKDFRYATDRFWTWQDNLRAIALGLEALRKVERYGIANRGEQYAGWAQLPAGGPSSARGEELIRRHGGLRQALMATHPDHGGDAADFADVQAARARKAPARA